MNTTPTARVAATLIAAAVLLSGCGSDEPGDSAPPTAAADIAAETASFDLAAGVDQRYLLGLFATEGGSIIDGTITLDVETLDGEAGDDRRRRGHLRACRRVRRTGRQRRLPRRATR